MERKRKIVPPVYLLLTLLLMTGLHYFVPVARIIPPPFSYVGIILAVGGLLMTVHSALAFNRAGTPVMPFERSTALVTGGFFRVTRNPMYLGMVLLVLGVALLFGTLTPFLPIVAFVWILRTNFIAGEERFMEELFGRDYLEYKSRVRRWL